MSGFLEFFKCILCCADESIDVIDNETPFWNSFIRTRLLNTSYSKVSIDDSTLATTTRNYPQHYSNSFLEPPFTTPAAANFKISSSSSFPKTQVSSKPSSSSSNSLPSLKPTLFPKFSKLADQREKGKLICTSTSNSSIDKSCPSTTTANYQQHYSNSFLEPPFNTPAAANFKIYSSSSFSETQVSSKPSSSSSNTLPSLKPTLFPKPSNLTDQREKGKLICTNTSNSSVDKSCPPTTTLAYLQHYSNPPPKPPASSLKPPTSSKPSPIPSFTLPETPTKLFSSVPELPVSSKPSLSSSKPSLKPTLSPVPSNLTDQQEKGKYIWVVSSKPSSSSSKPSLKPTLSPVPSNLTDQQEKGKYIWVDAKDNSPIFMIPEDLKDLIKRDIVPKILKKPLSPSTYKDYFAALLYAEDYYIEKWRDFELDNVSLELRPASIYQKPGRNKNSKASKKMGDKTFVVFKVDSVPMKRPFLVSRDFVFAQPSGKNVEPFQGVIYRVVRGTTILVEFRKDFHSQHYSTQRYNIRFSFNRFCLKRCHQAIAATSAPSLQKLLFPSSVSQDLVPVSTFNHRNCELDQDEKSAVHHIMNHRGPQPFLVKAPLCTARDDDHDYYKSFRTGLVIKETVLQIYRRFPASKILVCAPKNSTCDMLMSSLEAKIPVSDLFRANAAFRKISESDDILLSCLDEEEIDCFTLPSLHELREFRVIVSTLMSSNRLFKAGISAGHFTYIFLVNASSATEPEAIVALANLANENTTVIVTGESGNRPFYVRSDIARKNGLTVSYFERLCEIGP